ncbi:hypothetical protein AALB52_20480 [Lachnospiraceae bacterium 38-14]
MKYNTVYIVINEGEVVYASEDKEDADAYADTKGYEARQRVLSEWGNDDPSDEDVAEADLQAGMDGDYYEVKRVNLSNKSEDDTIELSDGTEIDVSDIIEKL